MFDFEINPDNIREVDIVVGFPSYNEEDNISFPVTQASLGLKKYFGDKKCVLINCDNHSPDDTKSAFLATDTEVPKIYITTPPDVLGKGFNFENLFRKACQLNAKIIICIDSDIESITPEWIKYLGESILEGHDYVTPLYSRHKYDGTITNNICFPLVYGVLGLNIRQPIGGDFALSNRFAQYVLLQPWHKTTEEYGIDIFLSMNSMLGDFKICQASLGAKIHKPSAPKLGPMFLQVVKTAFHLIMDNSHKWQDVSEVKNTDIYGKKKLGRAQTLKMDRAAIKKKAIAGYREHHFDIKKYLESENFDGVSATFKDNSINIPDDLWVKIVYDMLAKFKFTRHKDNIIEALRPLYFARSYTFMNDTWEFSNAEAETLVLRQAEKFYHNRNYLIERLKANSHQV